MAVKSVAASVLSTRIFNLLGVRNMQTRQEMSEETFRKAFQKGPFRQMVPLHLLATDTLATNRDSSAGAESSQGPAQAQAGEILLAQQDETMILVRQALACAQVMWSIAPLMQTTQELQATYASTLDVIQVAFIRPTQSTLNAALRVTAKAIQAAIAEPLTPVPAVAAQTAGPPPTAA